MSQQYANIVGFGKYEPENVLTNADLEKMVDTTDEWIVSRSGIRERRVSSENEQCSDYAAWAGQQALEMAGVAAEDLDLIIVCTNSPDMLVPPVSSLVQDKLGATNVGAYTLTAGCPGWVYGLVQGSAMIQSGMAKNVLVVGAELVSRFMDYTDRSTCVLFGDAAGAVLLQATDKPCGLLSHELGSDGSGGDHLILRGGGTQLPPREENMTNRDDWYVYMNGREVFKFATRTMVSSLNNVVADAGLTFEDIDYFVPHQANLRIIEYAAGKAKLPPEKVVTNVQGFGNTSAASIPLAMCQAYEDGRIKPGQKLAFASFGAGLAWAAGVFELGEF